ncbi:MAG: peptidylprolyl isomerase [Candidatus Sumerlaeia bacterium]
MERLRFSIISRPRRLITIFLCLAALALCHNAPYAYTSGNPALNTTYRGDPDHIIARCPWGVLSEQDLFLYLLMQRHPKPDIYDQFQKTESPDQKAQLQEQLREAIDDWAMTLFLASQNKKWNPDAEMEQLQVRVLLHTVYETIWIDNQVAPQVLIAFEDMLKHYLENPEDYLKSPKAQVRYIFLPVDNTGISTETLARRREEVRLEMDRIHNLILTEEITFEEAARTYSQAPNALIGGLTPAFGKGVWFPEFQRQAFQEPGPNSYSRIFYGPDGVYLLLRESLESTEVKSLVEVSEKVHKTLFFQQIQNRYKEELRRIPPPMWLLNRAQVAHMLMPGDSIMRVGDFKLTNERLLEIYPGLVKSNFDTPRSDYIKKINLLEDRERIYQECRRRGWTADPILASAVPMARAIRQARLQFDAILEDEMIMTRDEIREFYAQYADQGALEEFGQAIGSMIIVSLSNAQQIGQGNRDRIMEKIRTAMNDAIEEYSELGLEEVASQNPDYHENPAKLVPRLIYEEMLLNIAADNIIVQMWDTTQNTDHLSNGKAALADRFSGRLDRMLEQNVRFLPLVETEEWIACLYAVKPDYTQAPSADHYIFPLYQAIVDFIRQEAEESLMQSINSYVEYEDSSLRLVIIPD